MYDDEWNGAEEAFQQLIHDVRKSLYFKNSAVFPASWRELDEKPPRMINPLLLAVVPQGKMGMGVQTGAYIPAGMMVCFYGGDVHGEDTFNTDSKYTYKVYREGKLLFIDGELHGTIASFVNHSCSPNCIMETFITNNTIILGLISTRGIMPREFISVDYGDSYDFITTCLCGEPNCRDKDKYDSTPFPFFYWN